jgi:hypothetical protein
MVFDDAPGGGAEHRMVSGYMADHAAYGGALQAALGISRHWQHHETRGNSGNSGKLAHLRLLKTVGDV